jgi:hypothetical protein
MSISTILSPAFSILEPFRPCLKQSRISIKLKKDLVCSELRMYSGFDLVPSSQAGPVKSARPPDLKAISRGSECGGKTLNFNNFKNSSVNSAFAGLRPWSFLNYITAFRVSGPYTPFTVPTSLYCNFNSNF